MGRGGGKNLTNLRRKICHLLGEWGDPVEPGNRGRSETFIFNSAQ